MASHLRLGDLLIKGDNSSIILLKLDLFTPTSLPDCGYICIAMKLCS